jgi:alkylglycerol monooxygenase
MGYNLIALAIPFFFLLIGAELLAARLMGRKVYRFTDAITDLGCGIGSQLVTLLYQGPLFAGYIYLYDNFRLITFGPGSVAVWLFAFLGFDFLYYWWHRFSHEVNALWAVHIVHHQSEDYNLAVALRQAALANLFSWPFYLPLAILGVEPAVYGVIYSLNLLYQFWIHTELIPKLGFLELFLNTPSHHRVHHAQNLQYLDKNYGGTLIVWDRLFGSFEPEVEPCVYGVVKPLSSFDSLWAQVHYWFELWRDAVRAPVFADGLLLWVKGPTWSPRGFPPKRMPGPLSPETFVKYDRPSSPGLRLYTGLNLALASGATFALLMWEHDIPGGFVAWLWVFVFLALLGMGGLFEGRRWAPALELARWLWLLGGGLAYLLQGPGAPKLPLEGLVAGLASLN